MIQKVARTRYKVKNSQTIRVKVPQPDETGIRSTYEEDSLSVSPELSERLIEVTIGTLPANRNCQSIGTLTSQ